MKRKLLFPLLTILPLSSWAEARFPKPDFTSGYQYPEIIHGVPHEQLWNWVDLLLMVAMMSVVAWAAHRKKSRKAIFLVSIFSVLYFGFYRSGCVCSVGSIQNVILALTDSTYHLPLVVALLFLLPLIFAFFFGRVFCAGVCPLGALQELVNMKNLRIARPISQALSFLPWIYLAFTLLYAATRSQFLVCRLDPFVGIFRMGGDFGLICVGVLLLLISVFVGRPFCQFICPYGALLSIFGSISLKKMEITQKKCINCTLCHNSCPVDAIRPPHTNKGVESRQRGTLRALAYMLLLPLFTFAGGWALGSCSDSLSRAHKDVYLKDLLTIQEQNPDLEVPLEVTAFYEMGRSMDELNAEVEEIQKQYRLYAWLAGALIGFVLGYRLIRLSTKRGRETYEIDHAACVACGKCFDYCPQNKK